MDDPYFVLKMASLSCAATSCIAATMIGLGPGDGAAPRRTRAAAVAAIAFTALTLAIHWFEVRRHADSMTGMALQALDATARLEANVAELERAVQPIEAISMHVQVFVPMHHPLLRPYGDHFERGIAAVMSPEADLALMRHHSLITDLVRKNGNVTTPITVGISEDHHLFPTPDAFFFVRDVFNFGFSEIAFFKAPVDPREYFPFIRDATTDPDLRIVSGMREPLGIHKNLESERFFLSGDLTFSRALWEYKSSRVASMLDVAGTQMFITFGSVSSAAQGPEREQFHEVRREFDIDFLTIMFGNRYRIIEGNALRRYVTRTGVVYWEYRFPNEPSGLFRN